MGTLAVPADAAAACRLASPSGRRGWSALVLLSMSRLPPCTRAGLAPRSARYMQSAALAIACQAIRSVKAEEWHAVAVLLHSGAAKSTRACFDGGTGTGREH